jgi:hypothetical protein
MSQPPRELAAALSDFLDAPRLKVDLNVSGAR